MFILSIIKILMLSIILMLMLSIIEMLTPFSCYCFCRRLEIRGVTGVFSLSSIFILGFLILSSLFSFTIFVNLIQIHDLFLILS